MRNLRDYHDYDKVIRDMISKEIDRQHSFLNWGTAVHSILLLVLASEHAERYAVIVSTLGLLFAIISITTYWASEEKISRILYFWDGYRAYMHTNYFMYPPIWSNPIVEDINMDEEHNPEVLKIFRPYSISPFKKLCIKNISSKLAPILFAVAWLVILVMQLFVV